jgi:hypothetical protein
MWFKLGWWPLHFKMHRRIPPILPRWISGPFKKHSWSCDHEQRWSRIKWSLHGLHNNDTHAHDSEPHWRSGMLIQLTSTWITYQLWTWASLSRTPIIQDTSGAYFILWSNEFKIHAISFYMDQKSINGLWCHTKSITTQEESPTQGSVHAYQYWQVPRRITSKRGDNIWLLSTYCILNTTPATMNVEACLLYLYKLTSLKHTRKHSRWECYPPLWDIHGYTWIHWWLIRRKWCTHHIYIW